jgi:AcrR family transcriptional regulator
MANTSSSEPRSTRDETVGKIVAAAVELFADRGPDAVSLREVAARAGVNYGLIHHYIGTKDDLVRLVFRSVSEDAAKRFAAAESLEMALEELIRPVPTPAPYATMLSWAILQGRDANALLGRSPALTTLMDYLPDTGTDPARVRLGAVVAMNLGWQLFGQFIRSGVGLDDMSDDELTDVRRKLARALLVGEI